MTIKKFNYNGAGILTATDINSLTNGGISEGYLITIGKDNLYLANTKPDRADIITTLVDTIDKLNDIVSKICTSVGSLPATAGAPIDPALLSTEYPKFASEVEALKTQLATIKANLK